MEMKNMVVVGLLLIAVFALPSLASFEKDFISRETVQAILKKAGSNSMLDDQTITALTGKIVISNPILVEALRFEHSEVGEELPCIETCFITDCLGSFYGCSCQSGLCKKAK